MRPLQLKARSYRSFADLEYEFVDGATAVVGGNGAGKSSLIGAVDFALFGPRGRSLEPYVREGGDELLVELRFQHAGDEYRVRRGWRSGRSTLDLETWAPEQLAWEPLTQGSAADTQAHLEQGVVAIGRCPQGACLSSAGRETMVVSVIATPMKVNPREMPRWRRAGARRRYRRSPGLFAGRWSA